MGVEPTSPAWKAGVLADVRYLHDINTHRIGAVKLIYYITAAGKTQVFLNDLQHQIYAMPN